MAKASIVFAFFGADGAVHVFVFGYFFALDIVCSLKVPVGYFMYVYDFGIFFLTVFRRFTFGGGPLSLSTFHPLLSK